MTWLLLSDDMPSDLAITKYFEQHVVRCKNTVCQYAGGNNGTDLVNDQTASVGKRSLQPLELRAWCRHCTKKCCCGQHRKCRAAKAECQKNSTDHYRSSDDKFEASSVWSRAISYHIGTAWHAKHHSTQWAIDICELKAFCISRTGGNVLSFNK